MSPSHAASAPQVIVPLAAGFEELEAVTIVDVLRRAGMTVVFAGLGSGPITGSHGITITPDCALSTVDTSACRLVVLPGGMPGASNLRDNPDVIKLLKTVSARGGITAAICAAPMALAKAGLQHGKRMTSYPGFENDVAGCMYVTDRVVMDGTVTTSRGPGTALEFALALVGQVCGAPAAAKLAASMIAAGS